MREAANYLQAVAGAIADEMDAERKSRTNDVLERYCCILITIWRRI